MRKDYYMHQQFFLNVNFEDIRLKNYVSSDIPPLMFEYKERRNLFDFDVIERFITLSYLLTEFDKETQWDMFLEEYKWIDRFIIIVDVHIADENKIRKMYLQSTLKALVRRLSDFNKEVLLFCPQKEERILES